jgi:DNA-binding transcriptional ArsR family regulator
MCCNGGECGVGEKIGRFQSYFRALHCPTRWTIIHIIGEGEKGSGEILEELEEHGESLARSSLYYHLSELESAGIIELATYREVGGGAPEKVWKLKMREIRVDLLEDYAEKNCEKK